MKLFRLKRRYFYSKRNSLNEFLFIETEFLENLINYKLNMEQI